MPVETPGWIAERLVTAAGAADLVGRQFPRLRGATVEPLTEGWDNTVHLVEGRWVFRFPRRAVALAGVEREIAVLPRLAARLPLPVPVPEFVGTPSTTYPWPFWGARLLPGRELPETALPDARREPAARSVGAFLRALHDPDQVVAVGGELPVDPMRRGDPGWRAPRARVIVDRLARRGLGQPHRVLRQFLDDAERLSPSTEPPVVVHGDLHVRHLLVDDAGRATGVIDWGDLCLGDPAVDLSLAYAGFAGPARAALFAEYGAVPWHREVTARVLAVFLSAALAEYAASDGRPRLLREALVGLQRAVAD